MCRSKTKRFVIDGLYLGFTLPEVLGALVILALVSSGVVIVIHRSVETAAELTQRMQAFEVARENMEQLLTAGTVKEMVEYGTSERYPNINWQTVVETFEEPLTSQMWVRAVCSAEYVDSRGQSKTVELTHWLTRLTPKQVQQILEERQRKEQQMADELIETIEEAAEYAGVDVETIRQWVANGMRRTESGYFMASELDLYKDTGGRPTIADRVRRRSESEGKTDLGGEFDSAPFEEVAEPQEQWQGLER